jgi:hypothetical protein
MQRRGSALGTAGRWVGVVFGMGSFVAGDNAGDARSFLVRRAIQNEICITLDVLP